MMSSRMRSVVRDKTKHRDREHCCGSWYGSLQLDKHPWPAMWSFIVGSDHFPRPCFITAVYTLNWSLPIGKWSLAHGTVQLQTCPTGFLYAWVSTQEVTSHTSVSQHEQRQMQCTRLKSPLLLLQLRLLLLQLHTYYYYLSSRMSSTWDNRSKPCSRTSSARGQIMSLDMESSQSRPAVYKWKAFLSGSMCKSWQGPNSPGRESYRSHGGQFILISVLADFHACLSHVTLLSLSARVHCNQLFHWSHLNWPLIWHGRVLPKSHTLFISEC